jgi:hypothetical protein
MMNTYTSFAAKASGLTEQEYYLWRAEANALQADKYREPDYCNDADIRRQEIRYYQTMTVEMLAKAQQVQQ